MTTCGPATRETLARGPESGYPTVNATRDVVISMKSLVIAAAAVGTLAAGAAHAVTVAATEADDVTLSSNLSIESNINGDQFTFSWDLSGGDTGLDGLSAAVKFSIPGAAKISFDSYGNETGSTEQTGFVLYQVGGGPNLTAEAPSGVTGGGVSLVNGKERILIGDSITSVNPGSVLYDGIDGGDAFLPAGGGDWVVGIFDSGAPEAGSASFTISAVPLPASAWFLIAGVGAIAWRARRRAA